MANPLAPKVRGIKQSLASTIVEAMKNAQRQIDSLPLDQDPTPFEKTRDKLRDDLIRLSEQTITDLNDDPNLAQIVSDLDDAAQEAKKSAASLANASKKIEDFAATLGKIEKVIGGIIDIVA